MEKSGPDRGAGCVRLNTGCKLEEMNVITDAGRTRSVGNETKGDITLANHGRQRLEVKCDAVKGILQQSSLKKARKSRVTMVRNEHQLGQEIILRKW